MRRAATRTVAVYAANLVRVSVASQCLEHNNAAVAGTTVADSSATRCSAAIRACWAGPATV